MDEMVLIGCGFMIGAAVALGWMWWEFKQAPQSLHALQNNHTRKGEEQ